jgi:hypothetical protein
VKFRLKCAGELEGKFRLFKYPCPTFLITNSLKDAEVLCTQSSKQNKGEKKFPEQTEQVSQLPPIELALSLFRRPRAATEQN